MLPLVLETGVFSHNGVYSMKNKGKTGGLFKNFTTRQISNMPINWRFKRWFLPKPTSYSLKLPALVYFLV